MIWSRDVIDRMISADRRTSIQRLRRLTRSSQAHLLMANVRTIIAVDARGMLATIHVTRQAEAGRIVGSVPASTQMSHRQRFLHYVAVAVDLAHDRDCITGAAHQRTNLHAPHSSRM